MYSYIVTFDFRGITCPDDASELAPDTGYRQWLAELDCAVRDWSDVFAYRVLELPADYTTVVRLVFVDALATEQLVDLVQTQLYDEGCLSGSFKLGRTVKYRVRTVEAHIIEAETPEQAEQLVKSANPGRTILDTFPA